jgi:hypothetical protein
VIGRGGDRRDPVSILSLQKAKEKTSQEPYHTL